MAAAVLSFLLAFFLCSASWADATPRFVVHPNDAGGKEGETLIFQCGAEGDSGLVLKWQVVGVVVTNDTSRRVITSTTSTNGAKTVINSVLSMKMLEVSDSGAVMCLATDTSSMVATSGKVALTVYHINSNFRQAPKLAGDDEMRTHLQTNVGDSLELQCEPPIAYPRAHVVWLRNGSPVPLDTRVTVAVTAKPKPSDELLWRLLFKTTVPSDDGDYTCKASNGGGEVTSSKMVTLRVNEPTSNYATVVVVNPANVLTQLPGQPAMFACRAWGRPPPNSVTWHSRQGKLLTTNSKFIANEQNLTVNTNRAGKNSREAICHANGTDGSNTEETLTVHAAHLPPLNAIVAATVPESAAATFNCSAQAKSYPAPAFTWKDPRGNEIQSGIRRTVTSGTRYSVLTVSPVSLSDAGTYKCIARNPLTGNTSTADGSLTVEPTTKIVRLAKRFVEADIRSVMRLPCEVQNASMLEPVTWTHVATSRSVGKHTGASCANCRIYVDIDGTLVFDLPEADDSGVWTCQSWRQWRATNLTVVGTPYFTKKPAEVMEVEVGSTVNITCAAAGIPPPNVQWRNSTKHSFSGGKPALYESTLSVTVTSAYNEAVFRCFAGNIVGLNSVEVRLRVAGAGVGPTGPGDKKDQSDGNDNGIVVTIAIVIPCAVLYIVAMVVLVLWCQKRRYRLHRLSKEEEDAADAGDAADEEASGREMDNLQRKEALATVVEDAPPDYNSAAAKASAPPATLSEGGGGASQHPVAEEISHEPVRSKPPMEHVDETTDDGSGFAVDAAAAAARKDAAAEAEAEAAEPESPPVLHTPVIFRAAEAHGIPFTTLSEVPSFKRDQCKINKRLGRGYFCTFSDVTNRYVSGFAADTSMMMTKFSASSQDVQGYTRDILGLASLRHKNIASCVAASAEKHPLCMLSEYFPQGDLKRVLLQRDNEADLHLQYHHQLSILLQLCDALQYLSARRFVHRDVACHSCLINSSYQVKLAFYSRSEEGYADDYYTDVEGEEPLPVRWMAPEAIKNKEFTIQNDIWSFGVLMWEIFSNGTQPYEGTSNEDIAAHLEGGQRLAKPDGCPEGAYRTMQRCWDRQAKDRLHFSQLGTRLHQLSSTSDL